MNIIQRAACGLAVAALTVAALAFPAAADGYVWRNVRIGGGGYIPNIVYSPIEKNVVYARTDMGGVYRWDERKKAWLPLEDDQADRNFQGVESIAPDPVDRGVVYAAIGTYHHSGAAIFRSADYGRHWRVTRVPFRMGGNEEGRDLGERLAVDPNDNRILYFGSRHDGLQISTDKGRHWKQVASFPSHGLGQPKDWHSHAGISFVLFDPASGKTGAPTPTIYAGLADPGPHHLFVSHDAGKSWAPVKGEPNAKLLPGQAALSGGALYITYANGKGPYGVNDGAVFKFAPGSGKWTVITPPKKGAYMGLSADARHPGTLAVATLGRDGIDGDSIYRTADGGAHWTDLRPISRRDVSSVPWLKWGHKDANFGWWITGLAIDPFDSGHIAYTTGATIYASADLGKANMLWTPWVDGIEQTAVITLVSPRKGPHLYSGFGDIGGFSHFDLTKSVHMQENPLFTNTDNIDYAEAAPDIVVRSGTHEPHATRRTATLGYSTDYGRSWHPIFAPPPTGYVQKAPEEIGYNESDPYIDAHIVTSADGKVFVVMTPEAVRTADRGKSWTKIRGLPKNVRIVADRGDAGIFYAVDPAGGRLYVSRDGAQSFVSLAADGLPDFRTDRPLSREMPAPLIATPGKAGDLWLVLDGDMYHSSDGGKRFARVDTDLKVMSFDFGKAAPGQDHFTLYALGTRDGTFAVWQSRDLGKNWVRINDAGHEYCRMFRTIAADKRVFGRVYVGTDGRGILYGEPK